MIIFYKTFVLVHHILCDGHDIDTRYHCIFHSSSKLHHKLASPVCRQDVALDKSPTTYSCSVPNVKPVFIKISIDPDSHDTFTLATVGPPYLCKAERYFVGGSSFEAINGVLNLFSRSMGLVDSLWYFTIILDFDAFASCVIVPCPATCDETWPIGRTSRIQEEPVPFCFSRETVEVPLWAYLVASITT